MLDVTDQERRGRKERRGEELVVKRSARYASDRNDTGGGTPIGAKKKERTSRGGGGFVGEV